MAVSGLCMAQQDLMDRTKGVVQDTWNSVVQFGKEAEPLATDIDLYREGDPSETFVEVWERLLPQLDESLDLKEEVTTLPDTAWLSRDKQDAQSEIDELLDEAIGILGISQAELFREHIRKLQKAIAKKKETIAEYRRDKVTAPRESTWETTVTEYDEKIAELQKDILAHEEEMLKIRQQFAAHLRKIGLDLDEQQLDFLLSTVVGEDVVNMGIAFDNVKLMTAQLEKLVEESKEELQTARRYYGMYTVLLRVLDRMYMHLVERIDGQYLPRIDSIIERTEGLAVETNELLEQYPERGELLRGNLESQQLTLKASRLYRQYLSEQRGDVELARSRLNDDIRIANNTYETVKVSGELIAIVRNSRHLLETLGRMQVPALRSFENSEMKREFQRLTNRIREEQPVE
jgi:hypothetical protein